MDGLDSFGFAFTASDGLESVSLESAAVDGLAFEVVFLASGLFSDDLEPPGWESKSLLLNYRGESNLVSLFTTDGTFLISSAVVFFLD